MRTTDLIEADINNLYVDSLTLRVLTAANSDRHPRESMWLVVDTKDVAGKTDQHRWMRNFRYYPSSVPDPVHKPYPHLEPSEPAHAPHHRPNSDRPPIRTALVMGADPYDAVLSVILRHVKQRSRLVWRPQTVEFEVNVQQARSLQLTGRDSGRPIAHLEDPAAVPLPKPPVLKVAEIAKVRIPGRSESPELPRTLGGQSADCGPVADEIR